MPKLTSGWPSLAVSAAIRMSQAMASSHPPPRQNPLMAAISGLGNRSAASNTELGALITRYCATPVRPSNSVMSAPAMNAFSPAPVRTTTRTV